MKLSALFTVACALDEDPGWELLATSTGPELPRSCVAAPNVPASVQGSYFVGGPAVFDVANYTMQSLFDGYGKINRFEIGDGQVCYTGKVMNTEIHSISKERGYPAGTQFMDTVPLRPHCPLLKPMCELTVPADNLWVNSIQVGEELFWITDSYTMLKFDQETLDVKGVVPWGDDKPNFGPQPGLVPEWVHKEHTATTGSAHPLLRPGTSSYIDIITELGPMPMQKTYLTVYSFEKTATGPQKREKLAEVPLEFGAYLHGFGVTENYAILPLNLEVGMPNLGNPLLMGNIRERYEGVAVVGLDGTVTRFMPKEFYHVHVVNSFENTTGVTMDLGVMASNPFAADNPGLVTALFLNKTARDSVYSQVKNCVRRFHFHLAGDLAGAVTEEDLLCDGFVDFFRMHPDYQGKAYCTYYATQWYHDHRTRASMAILKHNLCTGEVSTWHKEAVYPGEPMLIPTGPGEDEGLLSFITLNGGKGTSEYVLLDARDLSEVAIVTLPEHVPFTAHGNFVSAPSSLSV